MSSAIVRHAAGLSWIERSAMARAAHAVSDGERVWLIDPFEDAAALEAAAGLGPPAGVIQLLDRHNRDCEALSTRLGVPLLRLPDSSAGAPFAPFPVVSQRFWREVGLWWAQRRVLIVAEAVGTVPAFALGRPLGVHPMLRLTPPQRALGGRTPDLLLVGHGEPLQSGVPEALRGALAAARTDLPKLILKLPSLIRGA